MTGFFNDLQRCSTDDRRLLQSLGLNDKPAKCGDLTNLGIVPVDDGGASGSHVSINVCHMPATFWELFCYCSETGKTIRHDRFVGRNEIHEHLCIGVIIGRE